jgi:hypothetical protein
MAVKKDHILKNSRLQDKLDDQVIFSEWSM